MDLQQGSLPALQKMYKMPDEKQLMWLQPLLNVYIQNKYLGDLLKENHTNLIQDVVKVEQPEAMVPQDVKLPSQDRPFDFSTNSERNENEIYHNVLNLSNYNEVVSLRSKSNPNRCKSQTPNSVDLNNFSSPQIPLLLNMYIQNKYFGELMKKESDLIEDMVKMKQIQEETDKIKDINLAQQDQPLDLSVRTKRSQNDMYHSLTHALNLSSYNSETVPIKPKSKRSRFKSPTLQVLNASSFSSPQLPTSSASESEPDLSIMVQTIKEEDASFSCHICGQAFEIQDRLAKHVASCHKTRKKQTETSKTYECEVCKRSFARSDMLTRHSRLHTGKIIKYFVFFLSQITSCMV